MPRSRGMGGGYLVETDGRRRQEVEPPYDDEQDILELLAAIMPVIEIRGIREIRERT